MFKKLLASVGIGSASVDLEVSNPVVEQGGTLEGVVRIKAGNIEQEVDQIYINLVLTSTYGHKEETKSYSKTLSTVKVGDKMTLKPGQNESFPVSFKIPVDMPVSKGRTNYYLQTGLDIQSAIDPTDKDAITVVPNKYLKMFFEAIQNLGFREQHRTGDFNGRYQEFEYKPTSFMVRELDEIEVYPRATEIELVIAMQIDKKNKGLFGGLLDDLDLDERYVHFTVPYSQMQSAEGTTDLLKGIIEREYSKIM